MSQPSSRRGPRQPSAVAFANILLRSRYVIVALLVLVPLGVLAFTLSRPRTYTSTAAVVPQQSKRMPGNIGGLAAQFGLALPGSDPSQSPAFYAELALSRSVLEAVADSPYVVRAARGPLRDFVLDDFEDEPLPRRREETVRWLREHVAAISAQRTGVVSLSAEARAPELAQQIVQRLLGELDRYNADTRRSQAGAERRFVERRLADAREELRDAENRLTAFAQRNRAAQAPHLRAETERLEREVRFRENVVSSLVEAYEQARIDEVRDTPVFTVIDPPGLPIRPDPRGLGLKLFAAALAGLVLGIGIALLRNALAGRTGTVHEDDLAEWMVLRRAALDELRTPIRRLVRTVRWGGNGSSTAPHN